MRHRRRVTRADRTKLAITDPRFNLREIVKEMLLLEKHLCHEEMRCPDCICKHLMTIEAWAEEAVQLDTTGRYLWIGVVAEGSRKLQDAYVQTGGQAATCEKMGKLIRTVRKNLWRAYMASIGAR